MDLFSGVAMRSELRRKTALNVEWGVAGQFSAKKANILGNVILPLQKIVGSSLAAVASILIRLVSSER
jgi:hypothetical protein